MMDTKIATYSSTAVPTVSSRMWNINNAATDGQYVSLGFVVKSVTGGNTPAGTITLVQPDHTAKNGNFTFTLRNAAGNYNEIMRMQSDGNVGIGKTPAYTLDINGTANCNSNTWTSDQKFKTNIDSLNNALATIRQLKPKSYYFDTTNVYGFKFQSQKQYGFIAQDVEKVLPDLVTTTKQHTDSSGKVVDPSVSYKSLNYIAFISILTKGIQELSEEVDSLKAAAKPTGANQRTNSNSDDQGKTATTIQIQLANNVILYQNEPNPFGESTIIRYYIPDNLSSNAYIVFYDFYGKELMKTELTEKGKGQINADTKNLTGGIYSYSIVVDGVVKDTKKMIKE